MKNHNRKAFTVVELVIVIAVIAILAAVLIPTFSGIVKKAHVSNDTQLAANMTMQLRVEDNDIRTEVELKKAMDAAYGVDYFPNLAPQSADQGYHFWFDITTQTVVLAKVGDLPLVTPAALGGDTGSVYDFENVTMGDPGAGVRAADPVAEFAPGAIRTKIVEGYYLMDRTGSDLADQIIAAEMNLFSDDIETLNKIKDILVDFAVINRNGALGNTSATAVYFSPFVDTIGGEGLDAYTALAGINISADIKVGPKALNNLNGNSADNANVYVDVATGNDLLGIFLAGESGKTSEIYVTISTGEVYQVTNNTIYPVVDGEPDRDASVGDLGYANNVASFVVAADSPAVNENGKFYVAYDKKTFTMTAKDFVGTGEGDLITTVTWSSNNTDIATIDNDGKVIVRLPDVNECVDVRITATADAGGAKASAIICVVRVDQITIDSDLGDLALMKGDTISKSVAYTGSETYKLKDVKIADTVYNYTGTSVICDTDYTLTLGEAPEGGNVFTIDTDGKTIKPTGTNYGTQSFTVKVGDYITTTVNLEIIDNTATAFTVNEIVPDKPIGIGYLFRIGNENSFTLSKLFSNTRTPDAITLAIYDLTVVDGEGTDDLILESGATDGTVFWAEYNKTLGAATWEKETIQFHGTGIAKIEISTAKGVATVVAEIVNGNNVVAGGSISSTSNNILLEDYTLSGGSIAIGANKFFWGNGFELNVAAGSNNLQGIVSLGKNSTIDNTRIVGAVYTEYTGTTFNPYSSSTILASAGSTISNSYVYGCRTPIRVEAGTYTDKNGETVNGVVYVTNSTLDGGRLANVEVQNGTLVLENVTTIGQPRNGVVGLGIVVGKDSPATTNVTITGSFTQYNYVTESDKQYLPDNDTIKGVLDTMFGSSYSDIHFTDSADPSHTVYANTGIVFLNNSANLTNAPSNYVQKTVTVSAGILGSADVKLYSLKTSANTFTLDSMVYDEWQPTDQAIYKPAFAIEGFATEKQNNTDYVYYKDGVIHLGSTSGTKTIENILNYLKLSKYSGLPITPNITATCGTVTNGSLNVTQDGTITITYADENFFASNGDPITKTENYTFTVEVDIETTSLPQIVISKSSDNNILWSEWGSCDPQYGMCIPILEGLVITAGDATLYNGAGQLSRPEGLTIEVKSISGGGNNDHLGTFTYDKKYNNKLYYCTSFSAEGYNNADTSSKVVVVYTYTKDGYQTGTLEVTFTATSTSSVKSSNFKNP